MGKAAPPAAAQGERAQDWTFQLPSLAPARDLGDGESFSGGGGAPKVLWSRQRVLWVGVMEQDGGLGCAGRGCEQRSTRHVSTKGWGSDTAWGSPTAPIGVPTLPLRGDTSGDTPGWGELRVPSAGGTRGIPVVGSGCPEGGAPLVPARAGGVSLLQACHGPSVPGRAPAAMGELGTHRPPPPRHVPAALRELLSHG